MLTRLTDRIEMAADGNGTVKIIRYGMWGITAEIERHGRKFVVINGKHKPEEFRRLVDAEEYMRELFRNR